MNNTPPTPPKGGTATKRGRKGRTKHIEETGFDDFWNAYPRKVAKLVALQAWTKLAPDAELRTRMLAVLEDQKQSRSWNKDDGAFIPHPATWLNQRRWEDQSEHASPRRISAARFDPADADRHYR
jgi:hypothetical protein